MATCSECNCYKAINDLTGRCKKKRVERHISSIDGVHENIVNGWPVVRGDDSACVEDFE